MGWEGIISGGIETDSILAGIGVHAKANGGRIFGAKKESPRISWALSASWEDLKRYTLLDTLFGKIDQLQPRLFPQLWQR
jgi:hypothetical protein